MDAYSKRVRALPGKGQFRTGVSLRAPFKEPSDKKPSGKEPSDKEPSDKEPSGKEPSGKEPSDKKSPESPKSEDRFILFVSFPYFGGSSEGVPLGPESESVKLLDFKRLGLDVPARRAPVSEEEGDDISAEEDRDDIGEILVHQARYMIFDNCKQCALAYCGPKHVTKRFLKI